MSRANLIGLIEGDWALAYKIVGKVFSGSCTVKEVALLIKAYRQSGSQSLTEEERARIIVGTVLRYFGVTVSELRDSSRDARRSVARGAIMYFLREMTNMSLERIADAAGRRDHSTVFHSLRRTLQKIKSNDIYRDTMSRLRNRICLNIWEQDILEQAVRSRSEVGEVK